MLLLKYERRKQRLSQDGLEQLSNVSQAYISFLENGRFVPTPAQLERLAKALNVNPPEALLASVEERRVR